MQAFLNLKFFRFFIVGVIGFFVDSGLTLGLIGLGLDPFSARLFAISLAMLTTWRLNRALTFGKSTDGQTQEAIRYSLVAVLTALINYTAYASLLLIYEGLYPLVAIILATGLAMCVSYFGYSRFAFKTAA